MRPRHPDKEIEAALAALERMGWSVHKVKGKSAHSWGYVLCPANAKDACRGGVFCRMSVWSTPRNPRSHARSLLNKAQGCLVKDADHDC